MAAELDALPAWPPSTVAVLATVDEDGRPHAIPVSTAVPAGPRRALLALALGRESLARLRSRPAVSLCVLAGGDVAFTVHGSASIVQERLGGASGVAAVAIEVESIRDHRQPSFSIDRGVAWTWSDREAGERDERVRRALGRLAGRLEGASAR